MKRIVTYELTDQEQDALRTAKERFDDLQLTRKFWEDQIMKCVELGLPVRLIGEWAGCSGANVSRLSVRRKNEQMQVL